MHLISILSALLLSDLRREEWHFGKGEDWRYADMRREHGAAWVITQFFVVSLAQHGMLVGLTLPLQPAMATDGAPLGPLDAAACAVCVAGILIGCVADNQLRACIPRSTIIQQQHFNNYCGGARGIQHGAGTGTCSLPTPSRLYLRQVRFHTVSLIFCHLPPVAERESKAES